MIKALKIRLYPSKKAIDKIRKNFDAARFAFNWGLAKIIECQKKWERWPTGYDLSKQFNQFKKEPGNEWLCEVDSKAIQAAFADLQDAGKRYLKKKAKFPKFKKKKNGYRTIGYYKHHFEQTIPKHLKLIKIGPVRYRGSKSLPEKILSVTVLHKGGRYHAVIWYDDEQEKPKKRKIVTSVGIDTGIKTFITLSDSNGITKKIEHSLPTKAELRRLSLLERRISRKPSDSKNKEKDKIRLQHRHQKISNRINDEIHKLTKALVTDYDEIKIESVRVSEWVSRNTKLNQRLGFQSLGTFYRNLEYKADWNGVTITKVNKYYPSSQLCSNCGYRNTALRNAYVSSWTCPNCGIHHDRDENASINILNYNHSA